jgi:hypothetical protein
VTIARDAGVIWLASNKCESLANYAEQTSCRRMSRLLFPSSAILMANQLKKFERVYRAYVLSLDLSSSRLWLTLVVDLVDVLMCIGN